LKSVAFYRKSQTDIISERKKQINSARPQSTAKERSTVAMFLSIGVGNSRMADIVTKGKQTFAWAVMATQRMTARRS
jgi:hypothetical protein